MRPDLLTFSAVSLPLPQSEDEIVDVLGRSGAELTDRQAEAVEAIIQSTPSAKIRNAAALALLDARYPRLEVTLNRVLARPDVAIVAGTLVFCLMEAEARVSAKATETLVRSGSYEARSELLILLSDGLIRFEDASEKESLLAELDLIAKSDDPDAAEVASLAIQDIARFDAPNPSA